MYGHLLLHHLGRLARITAISYQLESMEYIIYIYIYAIGNAYSKSRMKRQHELRRMTSNRTGWESESGWSVGVYFSWKSFISLSERKDWNHYDEAHS